MKTDWWCLPGPCSFIDDAESALRAGRSVAIESPSPRQGEIRTALGARFAADALILWREVPDDATGTPGAAVANALLAPSERPPVCDAAALAAHPALRDVVLWVDGIVPGRWSAWMRFAAAVAAAGRGCADAFRVCLAAPGDVPLPGPRDIVTVLSARGRAARMDALLHAERLLGRQPGGFCPDLRRALVAELSGWDPDLAQRLAALPVATLVAPAAELRRIASALGLTAASGYAEGGCDDWEGAPAVSAVILALRGDERALGHLVWRAQTGALFPWIEERRIDLVERHAQRFCLPAHTPFGVIHDPLDLDIGQVWFQLKDEDLAPAEADFLAALRDARHDLAHRRPVPAATLRRLERGWRAARQSPADRRRSNADRHAEPCPTP